MSDHDVVSPGFTGMASSPISQQPQVEEEEEQQQLNKKENKLVKQTSHKSDGTAPFEKSTASSTKPMYANSVSPLSEGPTHSKTNSTASTSSTTSTTSTTTSASSSSNSINTRNNRSKSIQQFDQPTTTPRGRQHIKIPNMNSHNGRSPLRSANSTNPSARLSTSRTPQNSSYPQNQRRGSVASIGDSSDFSTSLGMPYTFNVNGSSSTLNSISTAAVSRASQHQGPLSTASSPRNSFSSTFNSTPITDSSFSFRRYSDNSGRKPSTEEVFDLMEREQDAIVLKLMREIQQLKEDNRSLRQTINQLTSPSSAANSRSQSRSSIDSSRRRNSSLYTDDELASVSSSISNTPRSNFATLGAVPVTSSRKPSMNLSSAINDNSDEPRNSAKHTSNNPSNSDSVRSNTSTINMGNVSR